MKRDEGRSNSRLQAVCRTIEVGGRVFGSACGGLGADRQTWDAAWPQFLFFLLFFSCGTASLSRGSDADLAGTVTMTDAGDGGTSNIHLHKPTATAAMTSTASKQAISSNRAIEQHRRQQICKPQRTEEDRRLVVVQQLHLIQPTTRSGAWSMLCRRPSFWNFLLLAQQDAVPRRTPPPLTTPSFRPRCCDCSHPATSFYRASQGLCCNVRRSPHPSSAVKLSSDSLDPSLPCVTWT
ncbi:hypothetical protein BDD12DRAFT_145616 [Trichophaea hybrida]|nr:hypothetical protein BDD12DRAFT_145616 [Trichophaea hybrida]